jgi:hypothetical protein
MALAGPKKCDEDTTLSIRITVGLVTGPWKVEIAPLLQTAARGVWGVRRGPISFTPFQGAAIP